MITSHTDKVNHRKSLAWKQLGKRGGVHLENCQYLWKRPSHAPDHQFRLLAEGHKSKIKFKKNENLKHKFCTLGARDFHPGIPVSFKFL